MGLFKMKYRSFGCCQFVNLESNVRTANRHHVYMFRIQFKINSDFLKQQQPVRLFDWDVACLP